MKKIFTDSIFDVYSKPEKKTDIEKMAILAILVIAVGFIFIHVLLEFGVIIAILVLIGTRALYKILSELIS